MLTILGNGIADFSAEKDFGLAVWTRRATGLDRRPIHHMLHWKMLAVAQPHAVHDRMTRAAAALSHAFLS